MKNRDIVEELVALEQQHRSKAAKRSAKPPPMQRPVRTEPASSTSLKTGPVLVNLADIAPTQVSWLWPGRLPLGRITLLVGRPGKGKSFLTADIAARVSTGIGWPTGDMCCAGSVLFLAAEDHLSDTVVPRLIAHNADRDRIRYLNLVRINGGKGTTERLITLQDISSIEVAIQSTPDCRLMIVDPVNSFIGSGVDCHRDNEVRNVLGPLAVLAERHGVAVLLVTHTRKGTGDFADDLALGSRAYTGLARVVLHLIPDAQDKNRRLLLPGKNNLSAETLGLAFSIVGDGNKARLSWEGDPVNMSADDAVAAENAAKRPGPDSESLPEAVDFLKDALAGRPRLSKELEDEWKNGHGGSKRTLERAKKSLRVESYRQGEPLRWWCKLDGCESNTGQSNTANPSKDKQLGDLGGVAYFPEKLLDFGD